MAIFYTYPEVTPVLEDILLISQTNDKKKKVKQEGIKFILKKTNKNLGDYIVKESWG